MDTAASDRSSGAHGQSQPHGLSSVLSFSSGSAWVQSVLGWFRRHTGYPREKVTPRVIQFESDEQLQELLSEGKPVLIALHVPGMPLSMAFRPHFERMSAAYSRAYFMWVNCATTGTWFCFQRQPKQIPWVEMFHLRPALTARGSGSGDGAAAGANDGADVEVEITGYGRFEYSAYGIREFLKQKKGILPDRPIY